jgi:hypothetical protein
MSIVKHDLRRVAEIVIAETKATREHLTEELLKREFENPPVPNGPTGRPDQPFSTSLRGVIVWKDKVGGQIDFRRSLELRDIILDGYEKAKSAPTLAERSLSESEILDAIDGRLQHKEQPSEAVDNRWVHK